MWIVATVWAGGCDSASKDSGGEGEFYVVADDLDAGALLGAWTEGDELLCVGGTPGSGPGVIAHLNGEDLSLETVGDRTLWWIAGDDAGVWYAVGEAGTILREEAGVRTVESVPTAATLFGVEVEGTDVIAVGGSFTSEGSSGEVWRRRDGAWSLLAGDLPGAAFKVWDGWIVGDNAVFRLEGDELLPVDAEPGRLLTVRGRADDDVWAVGGTNAPDLRHWNGTSWAAVDPGPISQGLSGVWTAPGEDLFVAGNYGTAAFYHGDQWVEAEFVTSADLHAAWRFGDRPIWVGGDLFGGGGSAVILGYRSIGG